MDPGDAKPAQSSSRRARNYLVWCACISIAMHVFAGSYLRGYFDPRPDGLIVDPRMKPLIVHPLVTPRPTPQRTASPRHAQARRTTPRVASVPHVHHNAPARTLAQQAIPRGLSPQTEGPGLAGTPGTSGPGTAVSSDPGTPPSTLKTFPSCSLPFSEARTIGRVQAEYPDGARGASGETQVVVSLDARGGVLSASVYKSSGNDLLDRSAVAAARAATYAPEIRDCDRVAGSYIFVAVFSAQ